MAKEKKKHDDIVVPGKDIKLDKNDSFKDALSIITSHKTKDKKQKR